MEKMIHYSDHLERKLGEFLESKNIAFIHESQDPQQPLDFYLPAFDVHIEIKQYHTERIVRQLETCDEVILIQGKVALDFFIKNFNTAPNR